MNETIEEKRSIGELLKHPLTNVIIGFLLTGVLGTTLIQYYVVQREKQTKKVELATTRKASIAELSALNAEYLARAEMFLAATSGRTDVPFASESRIPLRFSAGGFKHYRSAPLTRLQGSVVGRTPLEVADRATGSNGSGPAC